ncbi:TIGR02444 family protein [Marinobacter salinus]|uniref:TIGR02444 family protein n=2 Tax=Marinobacter salinus TaxID=1874317 RepID=A0A1D9GRP9_9GAMM|nr:TIGR02444 family protein [Marinobacter salinus]
MSVSPGITPESPTNSLDLPENLEPDNPLWRFALKVWQDPGAQKNCLALQQQGWSVTRILCAGWLALDGKSYTGIEDATVTEWRDRVTGALRAARKWLPKANADCSALREGIAGLELEAERIELALAWHWLTYKPPEDSNMQGCDKLIRNNLEAAAPLPGSIRNAAPQLNALASTLANFPKGEPRP